jgi:hypothetical protein
MTLNCVLSLVTGSNMTRKRRSLGARGEFLVIRIQSRGSQKPGTDRAAAANLSLLPIFGRVGLLRGGEPCVCREGFRGFSAIPRALRELHLATWRTGHQSPKPAHSNRSQRIKSVLNRSAFRDQATAMRVLRWAAWAGVDFCYLRPVVR